ncbi:MAG: hypothetical protein LAN84_08805 [Acidobacteriia bacterium]|nr:hypothetical protein [Terriglobia bacterium]
MRSIASHWRAGISLLAACAALSASLGAAERPRYGGTLRVELRAAAVSLDPREWRAGSEEAASGAKLATLLFDRLVALDNYGHFLPQLAAEWSHDASFHRWQFTLRAEVKFSDGAPLTAADVAAALAPLLPAARQVSASGNAVVFQSAAPMPDLLEELASGRYFIYRAPSAGVLLGTGPFVLAAAPPSGAVPARSEAHLTFRANAEAWSGRPFVDAVEVTLGVPPLRQLYDLQLSRADLIELSPDLVRRAAQAGLRTWASAPVTLYALRFDDALPAVQDARLREALALSLDRATMAGVLLQKQAEPAAALLPAWLSGYAFLFTVETNVDRAREMRAALPATLATAGEPLRLRVDAPGDLARLLGDRIAVNARQALLIVQVVNRMGARAAAAAAPPSREPAPGMRLVSWRFRSLSPRAELDAFAAALDLAEPAESAGSPAAAGADPAQLHAREQRILAERRVLPLVLLPEFAGVGARVRDWLPAPWGDWHLAGVWLDGADSPAPAKSSGEKP